MDQALQRLSSESSFWETVVELLSDAVFLVGPDRRILYWNRAAEKLTGYTRHEVVGSHCQRAVHCTTCEHRCGVFEFAHLNDVPLVLHHRNGTRIEIVKNATVIRDDAGNPVFGIEVLRDVTAWNERERSSNDARQQAEHQKAIARSVLDAVAEGIIGVSSQGRIRFVSAIAESTLGIEEAHVLDHDVRRIVGPEIHELVHDVLSSRTEAACARVEVTIGSNVIPLTVTVSPLALPDDPHGAMLLVRDLRVEEKGIRERMRLQGYTYGKLISRSPRMQEVFDLIDQVSPSAATILIQGESGTGKELVAREIHKRSQRAAGPFHAVNCAAIASEILESEFFGHERGAFTGAVQRKLGRFEVAHQGTIFLDEVGELPLELQSKLLRVLEERSFERVGGTVPIQVDVRVIAATNRDLRQMVQQGRFREDLFYRLRVVPLRLPPLAERMEDVELLTAFFLEGIAKRDNRPVGRIGTEALRSLLDYSWPGNVRELANAMEYVAVVSKGPVVLPGDLPREIRQRNDIPDSSPPNPVRSDPSPSSSIEYSASLNQLLRDERSRIEAALAATKYRHGDAAKLLGMHRTTLYRKRARYGI